MNTAFQVTTAFQDNLHNTGPYDRVISNSAFTSHRVRVPELQSSWMRALKSRFDDVTSLQFGWDGYAGIPVSFTCANFAANMLERLCQDGVPPPSIVPGSDGTLQIEWHRNQFDVEIDVLGAQNIVATMYSRATGAENVVEIQNDFSEIAEWISLLSDEAETLDILTA